MEMQFTQDLYHLGEEISSARHRRATVLDALRADTKNLLEAARQGQSAIARATHGALEQARRERVRGTASAAAARTGGMQQTRADLQAEFTKHRSARQGSEAGRHRADRTFLQGLAAASADRRKTLQDARTLLQRRWCPSSAPAKAAAQASDDGADTSLRHQILAVINSHPSGIRVSDIESVTGISRMRLGQVCKLMALDGQVVREGNFYFPLR